MQSIKSRREGKVCPQSILKPQLYKLHERALRYRRLLHFVTYRLLGDSDRAALAVENCLYSASHRATQFDCEGAFRSWLVRLAIDEALGIFYGESIAQRRREPRAAAIKTPLF